MPWQVGASRATNNGDTLALGHSECGAMTVVPMNRCRGLLKLAALSLSLLAGPLRAEPSQTVEIVTKSGVRVFAVELVTRDEQVKKGLSGRKELPAGNGMLFDFRGEVEAAMGTKDTLIALDMIFIRADGRVHNIVENVEPLSPRQIYSNGPVRGVLEVPGGTSRIFGIAVGDRVAHPIFRSAR
jgi:uncharacterized membrane protein (UPF0127 family)